MESETTLVAEPGTATRRGRQAVPGEGQEQRALPRRRRAPGEEQEQRALPGRRRRVPGEGEEQRALPRRRRASHGKGRRARGKGGWRWRAAARPRSEPGGASAWWVRPAILAGIALVFLATGVALRAAAAPGTAPANRALLDRTATTQVAGDVGTALAKIFTYSPAEIEATEQAARDSLDGTAAAEYTRLITQIRRDVVTQQATLTTRVVRAGVVTLTADTARLLVFLDQTATRAGKSAGPAVAAQLTVTAHLRDGRWRITEITSGKAKR
ncbi:hypothetical protein [Nonomuraea typhae]|uniref:Mce-associated membrane protein n=1 Tax=Nonomuraea typhae TaxID=2603600 RepID=A0ABW7YKL5_9ACTN